MAVNFATGKTIDTDNFARSSHRTVNLFDKFPASGTGPFVTQNFSITKEDFKTIFYKNNGKFGFCLETDLITILGSKRFLSGWIASSGTGVALSTPISMYDVVDDVTSSWSSAVSIPKTNWSQSVYINIINALIKVNDWTNLSFSSALTLQEILTLFNQTDLQTGNRLQLSLVVDNANTSTVPVEIILNFTIA